MRAGSHAEDVVRGVVRVAAAVRVAGDHLRQHLGRLALLRFDVRRKVTGVDALLMSVALVLYHVPLLSVLNVEALLLPVVGVESQQKKAKVVICLKVLDVRIVEHGMNHKSGN